MKTSLLSVAAAAGFSLAATVASAVPISVGVFDINDFNGAINNGDDFVTEDFESAPVGGVGASFDSLLVGSFTSFGGIGTGSTCQSSGAAVGGECTELAIFADAPNSQDNTVPFDGVNSLNANDTLGIVWDVDTGGVFNRIVFGLSDAADVGATLTISTDQFDETVNLSDLADGNAQLVVIDFESLTDEATISLVNTKVNDSFAIDGASVGVVPLPAAGLLLIGGLGVLGAMRRRQKS